MSIVIKRVIYGLARENSFSHNVKRKMLSSFAALVDSAEEIVLSSFIRSQSICQVLVQKVCGR